MKIIPNLISGSRIFLSLALLFIKPLSPAFYVIYVICGCSDMLDGLIARRTKTTSRLGEKLDSLADIVMIGVLLVILYPIVNPSFGIIAWIIAIAAIRLAAMAVALLKYKTFASLHTYGNKITGLALFLFSFFLSFIHTDLLIYIICALASLSALEELAIELTSTELQVNRPGLIWRARQE